MKLRNFAIAAAALGLAAAPVAAEAVRDATPVENANALKGNSELFYVLGAAAIIAAIIAVASGGNDDPISG
jgi:hypothetical protein